MKETWRAELAQLEATGTMEEVLEMGTVYTMPAYYIYDMLQHNPIELIKELEKPTLILQGSNDLQVLTDLDFAIYEKELADCGFVKMHLFKGLNHQFLPSAAKNMTEMLAEYNVQAKIPGEVFDEIAAWIEGLEG